MEDDYNKILDSAQSNVVQERAFTLSGGAAESGGNILDAVNLASQNLPNNPGQEVIIMDEQSLQEILRQVSKIISQKYCLKFYSENIEIYIYNLGKETFLSSYLILLIRLGIEFFYKKFFLSFQNLLVR